MAYTSFISYNTTQDEQVVVYRLQAIASTSGITILLPQRNGTHLTPETKHRIDSADSVIAFLTSRLTPHVREELAYAEEKKKLIIPIYEKGTKLSSLKDKYEWIEFDPYRDNPGIIEQEVLELLKRKRKSKENRDALILVGIALGLFVLIASSK
ncbi:MAG: TIR domain-containing protein [Bacteroidota bacterium]